MFKSFTRVSLLVCLTLVVADGVFADDDDVLDVDPTKPNRVLLHVCKIDGTPIRPLVADEEFRHKFDRQGSPEVSADGKRVAFDAWAADKGFAWQEGRICIVNIDGTDAKDISDGVVPSFSPDRTKLVFGRAAKYGKKDGAKGMSIWMIDSDGKNKKMLADQGAWGARWSPDGKSIVFFGGVDEDGDRVKKSCLRLYDIETGKVSNVFSPKESPFSKLGFFFKWIKGKKRTVAFGGQLKLGQASAIATIDVDKGRESLLFIELGANGAVLSGQSFAWHPHDETLLGAKYLDGKSRLVSVATTEAESEAERLFEGIPKNVSAHDPTYTPDAKNIIVSFRPYQVPGE